MVEKSIKYVLTLYCLLVFCSCESRKSELSRQLLDIEKRFLSLIPTLQDNSVIITNSQGSRTGMCLAGGLVITASRDQDVKGDLISLDFTHAQQVQGAIVGKSDQVTIIRLVSNVPGLKGIDFSSLDEAKGLGLFVAFSDPNAPRPSVRVLRNLEKSSGAFEFDELDDGGALINLDGELCGVYKHTKMNTVYVRQFRRDWNSIFGAH